MATLPATTANWTTVLSGAVGGDIVELANGSYTAATIASMNKASEVIIRPANKDGAKFTGSTALYLNNCNNFTLDGIVFDGSARNDSWGYPTGTGLRIRGCVNLTIRNCLFDNWFQAVGWPSDGGITQNLLVEWNTWTRCGMDAMQMYRRIDGGIIRNNWFYNQRIDTAVRQTGDDPKGRHYNPTRHPDMMAQGGVVKSGADQAMRDILFENNWGVGINDYGHMFGFFNERARSAASPAETDFYRNMIWRNNRIISGHANAIAIQCCRGGGIYRNWISEHPDGSQSLPTINIYEKVGTSSNKYIVQDNVLPRTVNGMVNGVSNAASLDNCTLSGNVVTSDATIKPVGWVDFKYGRFAQDDATVTKPDALESTLVKMGATYDCGLVEFADGTFTGHSGVIIVQDTSVAWDTDPAKTEFQWRAVDEGVNSWKPTRVGTPNKNAAGSTRYEMRSDYETAAAATAAGFPGAHRTHARKAGGILMQDITLRWRPTGTTTWSDESTFSVSFTTPASGTAPNISAVTLDNSAYTVGQTATATVAFTVGSGTLTSLVVEWLLGTSVVSTQTISGLTGTSTSATSTFVTSAAGSLTARATLTTSVLPVSTRTSTAATVTAATAAPDITAVQLDKSAYIVGDVAVATATYTAGTAAATLTYQWKRDASNISGATSSTYTTVADDAATTLTCTITATSSAGSDNMTTAGSPVSAAGSQPAAPTDSQWEFAGVVSAPNLTNRFTAQARLLIPDASVIGMDWVGHPLPAMTPALVDTAAAKTDYNFVSTTAEGTNTAYHGMVAEIIAYEVWRGNTARDARFLTQLRRWCVGGQDPTGKGGLAMQYDVHASICIMAAKLTPRIWNALTDTERAKLTAIIEGIAIGAAYSASATSPTPSLNLVGQTNQPKNTPNWRTSAPTSIYCLAVFRGSHGAPDIAGVLSFFQDFSKSTFYAKVNGLGLSNMADTMQARGDGTLAGPTNAQVEGALDSWQFVARTGSTHWNLSDIMGIWKSEMEFGFSGTIASGLNSGAGVVVGSTTRGRIMAGAAGLPNAGLTGQLHQLDTTDAEGQRSSMSYAIRNMFNSIDMCLAYVIGGLFDRTAAGVAAVVSRIDRGMVDFAYKHINGYYSYAVGGTSMSEDWTPTLAYVVSHSVPVQLGLYDEVIKPYLASTETWRHTIPRGTDAQGRKLWELGPSATTGDQAHTVGYGQVSDQVYIRIATSGGTSVRTLAGKTFTGPAEPPPLPTELPALTPSDWTLAPVAAPGLPGRFTGEIDLANETFAPTVVAMDWSGSNGVWQPTVKLSTTNYRMSGTANTVAYGEERTDIRVRYTTTSGTSAASATKTLTAPAAPAAPIEPGEVVEGGALLGLPMEAAPLVRPDTPVGEIVATPVSTGVVSFTAPELPPGAAHLILIYADTARSVQPGEVVNLTVEAGANFALFTAVSAIGAPSVSRYFRVI